MYGNFVENSLMVVDMEISVRPLAHVGKDFAHPEDVVAHMLHELKYLERKYLIRASLIVFASPLEDDPVVTLNTAMMAIKHRDKGVTAFGILGSEIPTQDYDYFKSSFELLKTNHMNVLIGCGRSE
jgi:adenosine deaminase